ncbi:RING-type E3 ubiquitin transferase [Durusdinium trenchii]|uniref:RING-type E3 ubiquitin transferase n=1 Tax=Durusdinium trenchii TaxID=1381693 RepID=A0ABP0QZ05_9DINO
MLRGNGQVQVNLAALASAADYGEETSPDGKTRVRLRLPPVREGPMQQGLPRFLQSKDCGTAAEWQTQSYCIRVCTDTDTAVLVMVYLRHVRRVLFDLRASTTEQKYWPAFNIHLKTAVAGGPERFGFPDDGYCQRVLEELRENGVTIAEL